MLIHFGVIPYIVFDGDYLPSKAATEVERAKRREESKRKGLELYRLNKLSQAHLELQKAVDVTPEMARQLIDELKKIGVQYVVAPYEADAQLVYLERQGITQGMLSEDSDLLVFGAKRLLTKLDQYGDCVEINRADFTACREISLVGWSDAEFRRMAILSGCDYLASITRMGLKSAYRFVRKYKTIEKIIQMLQFDGQYFVPTGYLEQFYKAELTFLHQRVFCPLKNDIVMMTELEVEAQPEDFSFIGHEVEQEVAIGVAKGDLDPMTKQPIYVRSTARSTPKTPWGVSRRKTVDSFPDGKENKSIESFFKAKRTPLAELDPNSFTPSPTQARLVQQANGTTWESSPAPSGPPSFQPSVSMPSSTFRPALASRASQAINTASTEPAPPKRRRLCLDPEDSEELGNSVTSDVERSRFFTPNIVNPTPSVKHSRTSKRGKGADITIWSDDSVEDVMVGLPDVSDGPEPPSKGRVDVSQDSCKEKVDHRIWTEVHNAEVVGEDSQSSTGSRETVTSDKSSSTTATSVTDTATLVAQNLNKHVTAELKALSSIFAYQPETDRVASQRKEIQRGKAMNQPASVIPLPSKPLLQRQQSLTPLQRLGVGALNRSKSCSVLPGKIVNTSLQDSISSQDSNTPMQRRPGSPVVHSMGPDASVTKGSEDAIIPDSEDSADDALSEAEEASKSQINLGRFAFQG